MDNKKYKWFGSFWKACFIWTIGVQGQVATMISIVFAILATIGVFGSILAIAQQNENWLFTLVPLGVLWSEPLILDTLS